MNPEKLLGFVVLITEHLIVILDSRFRANDKDNEYYDRVIVGDV
jgi:hypothetical protein